MDPNQISYVCGDKITFQNVEDILVNQPLLVSANTSVTLNPNMTLSPINSIQIEVENNCSFPKSVLYPLQDKNQDNSKSIFDIYPNPASDILNVSLTTPGNFTYRIYDVFGTCAKNGTIDDKDAAIIVEDLSPGVYLFTCYTLGQKNSAYYRKLIKNM